MRRIRIITIAVIAALAFSLLGPITSASARNPELVQQIASGDYPGEGKRVIYSRSERRIWLVRADDRLLATWKVTGHPTIPASGTYRVYSRSLTTRSFDGRYTFGHMVRFARTPKGATLGFHDMPYLAGTSTPIMPLAKIGQPGFQSGGCVRQSLPNAIRMYAWAFIGMEVLVFD
jgi:hypothetical protein